MVTETLYVWLPRHLSPSVQFPEYVRTCNDLPEFGVQVDSAGQEHLHISGSEDGCPGGEEHLEAADVSVDLQQWLHIFGGGDVLGESSEEKRKKRKGFLLELQLLFFSLL